MDQQGMPGPMTQASRLKKDSGLVQHLIKAVPARTVELAGINQFQMFVTVNIKNSRGNKVISPKQTTDSGGRAPSIWFFQDHQWKQRHDPSYKRQATSTKHHAPIFRKQQASIKLQAASVKLSNQPVQSPSDKHPILNNKRQASSRK